jgi:hypothetical protein
LLTDRAEELVPMGRIGWIAAGAVFTTGLAILVNLVTSGGAWWLWPALAALLIAAIAASVMQDRRQSSPTGTNQDIRAANASLIEDSPQLAEREGVPISQSITARRKGIVRRSGQTIKSRP